MILPVALTLLLQGAGAAARPAASGPQLPVQLGVSVTSDTVTVGQRFVAIVRIRAPRRATIEFPTESDSAAAASPTATELIGKPVVQPVPDSTATTMTAAYRLAAWDVGPQRLGLGNVVVRLGGRTGYVSLADRGVFVRSVLPENSALRVAKPPRPAIELEPFDWLPWVLLAAALLAAALAWRVWVWYRRRKDAPLDPFAAAEREFSRIEATRLTESGEGERHATLMTDVLRDYLVARVPGIARSHTSSELLAAGEDIRGIAGGLGELLWRTDLIKFANTRVAPDEAVRLGSSARGIARAVESHFVEHEQESAEKRAA